MKPGDLVKHAGKPEWGAGVVVECIGDKCTLHFEEKGRLVLKIATAAPHLAEVTRADVAADSALLDPQKSSQYSEDKKLKSCPRCSTKGGREHVFYDYPDAFGQTDARVSETTPDGAQSYCATCRTNDKPLRASRRCSSVALR